MVMPDRPQRRFRVAAVLVGGVIALLGAEAVVATTALDERLVTPLIPRMGSDPQVHRASADAELLYELVPGAAATFEMPSTWGRTQKSVRINALGFRDTDRRIEKPAGTVRVICVGGSTTYGAVVDDSETWPRRLEQALSLATQRSTEAWNLGVSGYMTRQKVRLIEQAVTRYSPDLILLESYNTGPRYRLFADEPPATLLADTQSWLEFLTGPTSQPARAVFRRSALARAVFVADNRIGAWRDRASFQARLTQRTESEEVERLSRLRRAWTGPARLLALITPAGFPLRQLEESEMPYLDMRTLDVPATADAHEVHPSATTYAWYAEALAEALVAAGCLEGGPCFGAL